MFGVLRSEELRLRVVSLSFGGTSGLHLAASLSSCKIMCVIQSFQPAKVVDYSKASPICGSSSLELTISTHQSPAMIPLPFNVQIVGVTGRQCTCTYICMSAKGFIAVCLLFLCVFRRATRVPAKVRPTASSATERAIPSAPPAMAQACERAYRIPRRPFPHPVRFSRFFAFFENGFMCLWKFMSVCKFEFSM